MSDQLKECRLGLAKELQKMEEFCHKAWVELTDPESDESGRIHQFDIRLFLQVFAVNIIEASGRYDLEAAHVIQRQLLTHQLWQENEERNRRPKNEPEKIEK